MDCFNPIGVRNPSYKGIAGTYMYNFVPCGKCEACLRRKQNEWFSRMKVESRHWDFSLFVTLTYDEEKCPLSVKKDDVQKFFKRLRADLPGRSFKYFLCSEYGPENGRPHYHAIIFGLGYRDASVIEKAWNNGFIKVDLVNDNRIRYVTGYIIEKNFVPRGKDSLFTLISKGIGAHYLEDCKDFHTHIDRMYIPDYSSRLKMPRYLKEKLYSKGQRKAFAEKCQNDANERVAKQIADLGFEEWKRINYSFTRSFIRKMQNSHKRKKQNGI